MAKYLYNGVELPALPSRKHQYWLIYEESPGQYTLANSNQTMRKTNDGWQYNGQFQTYNYIVDGDLWASKNMTEGWSNAGYPYTTSVLWSNYDILTTEGYLYLPASEPESIGTAVYMDVDGMRQKIAAYKDISGVRTLISGTEAEIIPTDCLTFSAAKEFTLSTQNSIKGWDGTLYYSTDTQTWREWDGTEISSAKHGTKQRIYMRGSGNSVITGNDYGCRWKLYARFYGSGLSCFGNIENLLDYETVANGRHPTMSEYCYAKMFSQCTSLVQAPELPATTLSEACYYYMFDGCTSLTTAPELPATTLAKDCYFHMFDGCTSLVTAPDLPATTLEESYYSCYNAMFKGCTSLVTAPELPATTISDHCYSYMFYGCTRLTALPKLPATILRNYCYQYMFGGCKGIKLSQTQTGEYTTEYRIPTSGKGIPYTNPLSDMFYDTGGTFTGTPEINKTYYTSNTVV